MATQSATTQRRTRQLRARSLIELGVVVVLSVGVYRGATEFDLFGWVDRWGDLRRHLQAGEVLLLVMPLGVYAWRRSREAQTQTAVAVAVERDLARTSEEYRSLFDHHPRAVFSIDPQRRYRRVNPAAEVLSGYTEEELQSLVFPVLKTEDRDRVLAAFEQAMDREPQRLETSLMRKDGQLRDVEVTMVPIVVAGEPVGVYVVAGDVTDDKQMRRELARALAEAQQADEAKTLLVANVSHELRTPLTSVIGAAEMLSEGDLHDIQQRLVAMIGRNGQMLLRLVDDLLDVTRMTVGQLTVEAVPFDLCEVLDRTVAHVSSQASSAGLALKVEVDDPMPGAVVGDPLRVGQVLTNLLGNAVKFTDEGEVGLGLSWKRRDDGELEAVFRVWDTGIGIAPADRERLFGHFMQADPSSTRRHGGVGLGLAITRQLVQLMGGTLSVESQLAVGSTFTVRLPLQLAGDR